MNRADFVCALAAAATTTTTTVPSAAISAQITIKSDSDELLAPFSVTIAVRNSTPHTIPLDFPTADVYRIDVRHDDRVMWSTATGHRPLLIARRVDVAPGVTRLASQIVDGTTDDRRAFAPGRSIIHVALLGTTLTTSIDKPISFAVPVAIADARGTPGGTVVTIAGIPRADAGIFEISDDSGSLRLSRPLGLHPTGTYVVRGYIDAAGDELEFAVGRFAPAFDNVTTVSPKIPA